MESERDFFNRIMESFKKMTLTDFQKNLYKYPDVEKLLDMTIEDMKGTRYEKYAELLLPNDREYLKDKSLFDLMLVSANSRLFHVENRLEVLYSYNDKEEPVGWFCYEIDRHNSKRIENIKMFSFGTNDISFMRDVKEKFLELIGNYDTVSWVSTKTNPFLKHYIRAILEYNGSCSLDKENSEVIYTIDKNNPNDDFSNLEEIFDKEMLRKSGYYKKILDK